ncbi:MAG: homocysteine S-methyltransferase family protein [Myxococcota bacterium]|nr:homocysteine S-methyltransferase family protein [Myxococcota bacterium]
MSRAVTTLLDGGTGTELRMRGIEVPSHITSIWSARALFADPDAVVRVHADYIAAGADVITANNYAVTPPLLAREGIEDRLEELTLQAVELACRARDASGRPVRIAGSLPPLDTSYRADLVGEDEVLRADYRRIAELLAPRVDLLLCETLSSSREAVAAAAAAAGTGCEFWLSWTLQGSRPGHLPSGESVAEAFAAARDCGASAYLVNCCGANFVEQALPDLRALTDAPIGGYANAADAVPGSKPVAYTALEPEAYASAVMRWVEAGATRVGGCCFTRPAHIARVRELLDSH